MAKFCGGIKLDPELFEIIDGIICLKGVIGEEGVDATKAISTCGQLWDGDVFTVRDGVITMLYDPFEVPPVPIKGSCGIGLDGCYFKLSKGVATLIEGGLLTVNVTPDDATIEVIDVNGNKWDPIAGTTNIFVITEVGTVLVEVSKTGYITETKAVRLDADHMNETIEVALEVAG